MPIDFFTLSNDYSWIKVFLSKRVKTFNTCGNGNYRKQKNIFGKTDTLRKIVDSIHPLSTTFRSFSHNLLDLSKKCFLEQLKII